MAIIRPRAGATACILLLGTIGSALADSELRFCLRAEPKTLDPLLASDEPSDAVRYLTGGVLIRFNRKTQKLESGLAKSWEVSAGGRRITFYLRRGIMFSDGTPFSANDVAATMKRLLDPQLHSAIGDTFRSGVGSITTDVKAPDRISILFTTPVAGVEQLFDQVSISPAQEQGSDKAVLGPYALAEHVPGSYILLRRNTRYWQSDSEGHRLPYIDAVRLFIQQNRDIELRRFRQGELHFITNLDPEAYERLRKEMAGVTYDAGPSLDSEMIWFNQMPTAPIPPYKRAWFQSQQFRRAISDALHREDMCRLVYHGHAHPAVGPVSKVNLFWFNSKLKIAQFNRELALRQFAEAGFRQDRRTLRDSQGNIVEFSLITNSGSPIRAQLAAIIQQDLKEVGIRVNEVPLDFASLIGRIARTFDYEACVLGLTNIEPDPNSQMNVWLSSGSTHPWYPNQKTPHTHWEAEMDRLMRAQAATLDSQKRKMLFDQVQEIVSEQAPVLYLVNRNALMAISAALHNASPAALSPNMFWNVEHLRLLPEAIQKK